MNTMLPILSMQRVTKKFVGTVALDDVSFDLNMGEILAVVGENGAGKSTLMKILSGNFAHNEFEGEIYLNGKKCHFNDVREAEAAGIVMIHQEINLELDLSVTENIMLGCLPKTRLGLIDWKKANARAVTLMKLLNLHDIDVEKNVRQLSVSDQQLVSIARALNRNPIILILDEPTSCLNKSETQTLFDIIRDLRSKGLSCVYISHKIDELFEICDRALVLRDGGKISEYEKKDFDSNRIIEDIVGRKIDAVLPTLREELGVEVMRVENFTIAHPYAFGKTILEDVSFSLRRGEILGLYGLVGSGRSELLGSIFGSVNKLAGNVYLNGQQVEISSPIKAKQLGIGMVTEDRKKDGFIGMMSIKHNISITVLKDISKYHLIDGRLEDQVTEKFADKMRIKTSSMDSNANTLSGGNQQKLIIAKWLATKLKILLLDDPTRGIDIGTKFEIYTLIKTLASQGLSIIVTSSEVQELIGLCDRFLVLSHGQIRKELQREEATEANLLFYSLVT
jgi:D-xylose transport system ATP-binding protein